MAKIEKHAAFRVCLAALCGAVFGLFYSLRDLSDNLAIRAVIAGIGAALAVGIYIAGTNYRKRTNEPRPLL